MHPLSFLLAVVVLAVPTHAITELSAQVGPSPALYALSVMQAPGLEFGRFFDQAALSPDSRLVKSVIAAYNAGPRWVSRRPMYRQTREYVRKVLMFYRSEVSALI